VAMKARLLRNASLARRCSMVATVCSWWEVSAARP
jgi:hypothetical protein